MNFYEKHIGDYTADTVGLTMLEDGAYNRLLDVYYKTERPLPADKAMVYRLARATSTAEKKAVDFVLDQHFALTPEGYAHKRVEAEIARYQEKQRKAKASAEARWSKSERNANASETHDSGAMRTHSEGNAHQSPDTIHQTPKEPPQPPRKRGAGFDPLSVELPDCVPPEAWAEWAADRKARGKPITERAAVLQLRELADFAKQGVEPAVVIRHSIACGYQGLFPPRQPQGGTPGASPALPADRWWLSNEGIDRKGREMGLFARGSESYGDFRSRIFDELRRRGQRPPDEAMEQRA